MSWDLSLFCNHCGSEVVEVNYTHNTNGMMNAALEGGGWGGDNWLDLIDGMTGTEGKRLLRSIISEWDYDPDKFRAMNPDNGWGDMDQLRKILMEDMIAKVPECASTWKVTSR